MFFIFLFRIRQVESALKSRLRKRYSYLSTTIKHQQLIKEKKLHLLIESASLNEGLTKFSQSYIDCE